MVAATLTATTAASNAWAATQQVLRGRLHATWQYACNASNHVPEYKIELAA